jgi:hypothetical protein
MNSWCICWFSRIILLGILIFKGLTAGRLYKSFGIKGLKVTKKDTSMYLPQGIEDRSVSIHSDSSECEDTHIHTQHLDKRTEGAHKVRQVPALQQRRLELK